MPGVLAALPDGYRAIVVDNGSRDATARVAADHGAEVVSEARAEYGTAVHAGLGGDHRPQLLQRLVHQLSEDGRVVLLHPAGEGHVEDGPYR